MTDQEKETLFDSVEDLIEAIGRGEMVIVTDDEGRENEGDFVMASDKVSAEAINFMTRVGRGLLCVAMQRERLEKLNLSKMTSRGDGVAFNTAFVESVDARSGITTGISAQDRCRTVQVLVAETSTQQDLATPGHMFPLEAMPGGVLRRAGHTEAAVDLARFAGCAPSGVICEILSEDGSMARLPELRKLADEHGLRMGSIADMIAYRRGSEKLVKFVRSTDIPTNTGVFSLRLYESLVDGEHHVAFVMGQPEHQESSLARVHSECLTGDVFGSLRCDCGTQLHAAMEMVSNEGHGVVLYMRQEGRGIGLEKKIHAYALQQERGLDTVEANEELGLKPDLRDYGIGAQILYDIGLRKIRLITNNPRKVVGLDSHGLEIVDRVPLISPINEHSAKYIKTKRDKLGHWL
jgi:3,4-dihydroxy 2-butanone 4-phosphate synthase/GTP cyclohydrolase II